MINNFDLFPFEFIDGEFYFFQIIKRKKDNPDTNHARCIKTYSIYTKEQLEKRKQEMIDICNVTNSRLYMHPARRSKQKVQLEMLKLMTENIISNKHTLDGLYNTACGQLTNNDKLRVVDIDDGGPTVDMVEVTVNNIRPFNVVQYRIKTKNGRHLITKPFDLREFKLNHPDIDVHKNNPTIIYIPGDANPIITNTLDASNNTSDDENTIYYVSSFDFNLTNGFFNKMRIERDSKNKMEGTKEENFDMKNTPGKSNIIFIP